MPSQLAAIEAAYQRDLRAKAISDDLLYDICHLIEDCQRALDWTATDIDRAYGSASDRSPYFPLREDPKRFVEVMTKDFPSVPQSVYDAIQRHQPYQPGKDVLGHLHDLARVNKHQDFTAQTRTETRRIEVSGPGGSKVSWSPDNVRFGSGVSVMGAPIDPLTQLPVPSQQHTVNQIIYVGWKFTELDLAVLPTLGQLTTAVVQAVRDVRHEAHL
jgi:hypothetical protein